MTVAFKEKYMRSQWKGLVVTKNVKQQLACLPASLLARTAIHTFWMTGLILLVHLNAIHKPVQSPSKLLSVCQSHKKNSPDML